MQKQFNSKGHFVAPAIQIGNLFIPFPDVYDKIYIQNDRKFLNYNEICFLMINKLMWPSTLLYYTSAAQIFNRVFHEHVLRIIPQSHENLNFSDKINN